MREIKFRAFDKSSKLMIGSDYPDTNYSDYENEYFGRVDKLRLTFIEDISKDKDYEVMQYTGLIDVNGKEIYEGDIVEWINTRKKHISVVEYHGGMFCFNAEKLPEEFGFNPIGFTSYLCVIGNIYENPELLEVKNES